MLQLLILLALTTVIFMQTVPAYCGVPRTITLKISATVPEHVMTNNNPGVTPFSNNAFQLVQTQTAIRNNKSINLTSIVVL
jgi:hypothetical protein